MTENLPAVPQENEFKVLQTMARAAASSGLYNGVGSEQKILMILLAARELGIQPMTALNGGLWNIQGKIEISARLMNAMIRKAGHSIVIRQCDASKCILEGKRSDNGDTFSSTFTYEEAQRAGLTNRQVWKTYTEDMLYARAMSRLARRLFPDVIGSSYVEGEIRDIKCEVIESEPDIQEDPQQTDIKLNNLLACFPKEDHEMIKNYLDKYSNYWKKNMSQTLLDYENIEKFGSDFSKWKSKELDKNKS